MHIDGLLNYDAAHGFHLPNGTRHENTVRKPSDIAGQHHLNIYEAEMFQCLRVEQWSVLEAVTVPCTRNIFMHLTSFSGNFRLTPQSDTDASLEWRETFHHWNDRARTFAETAGLKLWSYCVCVWAALEISIARKIFVWNPPVQYRPLGRRPHTF